jgi:glycosyltransferase involved in cell wall biosynthesis
MPMLVLIATRPDIFTHRGGDTTQVQKTVESLQQQEPTLEVQFVHTPEALASYPAAHVLHAFDMRPDTIAIMRQAKQQGLPVVLTPIYWDFTPMYAYNFLSRKLKIHSPHLFYEKIQHGVFTCYQGLQQFTGKQHVYLNAAYRHLRQEALTLADAILPNSPEEGDVILSHFAKGSTSLASKIHVVPNAVEAWPMDATTAHREPLPYIGELTGYVLEVARIEPNKNQLGLLQAMCLFPEVPLVLIGRLGSKQDTAYYITLQRLAKKRGNTWIIQELPHEQLPAFYQRAKVHAMPSFRESAGLSSMEALISGVEVITSQMPYCPTRYYQYEAYAHHANPWSVPSITNALDAALNAPPKNTLNPINYLETFSYAHVAQLTYACYQHVRGG